MFTPHWLHPHDHCHEQWQLFHHHQWFRCTTEKSHDTTVKQTRAHLPAPTNDDDVDEDLALLFGSGNFHFGNPVDRFKSDFSEGKLSPDSQLTRRLFWKSERRNYKARMKERAYTTLHDMLKARDGFVSQVCLIWNQKLVGFNQIWSDLQQNYG